MRIVDLIRAVRDGDAVSNEALTHFVNGVADGTVPDYQAAAFTMAVFHKGLAKEATVALTLGMRDSGDVIDLSSLAKTKVDKHSTGGVGDKISLPLAPLVAACGVPVPMISGRGLGHTGGTLDKLESIPGFNVNLSIERFKEMVKEIGFSLIGQTKDLAPADKKLYSLRDVTATVESVPLITASILSKKLAEGIDALVLDVKVGRGAFMKTEKDARELANSLVDVGRGAGLNVRALLTRMDEPLGTTIGNALEVRESIDILFGRGPADSTELTMALGAEMLILGKVAKDETEARKMLQEAVDSGRGAEKFREVIKAQGGDPRVVDDPSLLPQADKQHDVHAQRSGFVAAIDSYALGIAAMKLGAGRTRAEDVVDPAVGIEIFKKSGDEVKEGELLATVHLNGELGDTETVIHQAYSWSETKPKALALVIDRI